MEERIIRLKELCEFLGLNRVTIYNMVEYSGFPKPIKLGKRAIGWKLSDINKWVEDKTREINNEQQRKISSNNK